jgi:hypothetical protein
VLPDELDESAVLFEPVSAVEDAEAAEAGPDVVSAADAVSRAVGVVIVALVDPDAEVGEVDVVVEEEEVVFFVASSLVILK